MSDTYNWRRRFARTWLIFGVVVAIGTLALACIAVSAFISVGVHSASEAFSAVVSSALTIGCGFMSYDGFRRRAKLLAEADAIERRDSPSASTEGR